MHRCFSLGSVLFACIVLLVSLMSAGARAQQSLASDVRLVIDVSGSMKRNDPNNLRQPSVELLMQLLPAGSKAGVWTFGKYVNMLVPHKEVDEQWRAIARDKAKNINSVGLFTNIGEALERAAHDAASPSATHKTSIILLTDGMVDVDKSPDKNKAEWRRIADEVLPKLKAAGFTVHTIALSKNADKDLMQKLALSTDGTASVAMNAEDLLKIFLKAFDVAAPAQKLPLVDNSFVVDSSVEEFTALIFRKISGEQTKLVGPDEKIISEGSVPADAKWHHTDKYDLVTVSRPLEGEWKVEAAMDPDSRVTVVSDLNLRVKSLPSNLYRGAVESVNFVLQEDGKVVTRPDFLGLLTNSITIGFGAGDTPTTQKWQFQFDSKTKPEKGVYRKQLPVFGDMGTYDIQITVDGKTFKREFLHRLSVREPFSAQVSEITDEQGQAAHQLTVRAHGQDIILNKTQIAATIVNPKRRKFIRPLALTEYDNWQVVLDLEAAGTYSVEIQVTGLDVNGDTFEYSLSPIVLEHQPDEIFSDEVPPVALENEPTAQIEPSETAEQKTEDAGQKGEAPLPDNAEELQGLEETENESSADEAGFRLPPWALYAILGLGNLLLIIGGFLLFKKLMSDGSDEEEELDELMPETEATPPEETASEPVDEPAGEQVPEVDLSMDDGASEDEAPPMEDLGGDGDASIFEDDEDTEEAEEQLDLEEPPPMEDLSDSNEPEVFDSAADAPEEEIVEDDFGVDDIEEADDVTQEDVLVEQVAGEESEEAKEDFAKEMLKAQGLDLPEDELDDAISSLIDELDGERGGANMDDFDDFDDFGLDDDKKK